MFNRKKISYLTAKLQLLEGQNNSLWKILALKEEEERKLKKEIVWLSKWVDRYSTHLMKIEEEKCLTEKE